MRISNRIVSTRATVCIEFQGEHYAVDALWTLYQKNANHAGDLSRAAACLAQELGAVAGQSKH